MKTNKNAIMPKHKLAKNVFFEIIPSVGQQIMTSRTDVTLLIYYLMQQPQSPYRAIGEVKIITVSRCLFTFFSQQRYIIHWRHGSIYELALVHSFRKCSLQYVPPTEDSISFAAIWSVSVQVGLVFRPFGYRVFFPNRFTTVFQGDHLSRILRDIGGSTLRWLLDTKMMQGG